jgi:hypothetical protein
MPWAVSITIQIEINQFPVFSAAGPKKYKLCHGCSFSVRANPSGRQKNNMVDIVFDMPTYNFLTGSWSGPSPNSSCHGRRPKQLSVSKMVFSD